MLTVHSIKHTHVALIFLAVRSTFSIIYSRLHKSSCFKRPSLHLSYPAPLVFSDLFLKETSMPKNSGMPDLQVEIGSRYLSAWTVRSQACSTSSCEQDPSRKVTWLCQAPWHDLCLLGVAPSKQSCWNTPHGHQIPKNYDWWNKCSFPFSVGEGAATRWICLLLNSKYFSPSPPRQYPTLKKFYRYPHMVSEYTTLPVWCVWAHVSK